MNEIIDKLLPFEHDVFLFLNGSDSLFVDNIMWTVTGRIVWIPILLLLLFMFFYKKSFRHGLLIFLFFLLVILLCDQISSSVFKPLFQRYRPTHHPEYEDLVDIVKGYRGGTYGFISGHATNTFGIAAFLSLVYKSRKLIIALLLWATLTSYSRIYLGVHFISDIIAGIIVGLSIGFIIYRLYVLLARKILKISKQELIVTTNNDKKTINLFAYIIMGYQVMVILLSPVLVNLPH